MQMNVRENLFIFIITVVAHA